MGYDNQIQFGGEENSASFNDALNHILRIDLCLRLVHQSRPNPFLINPDSVVPNFQIRLASLSSCWQEIKPFCEKEERDIVERMLRIVKIDAGKLIKVSNGESMFDYRAYSTFDENADHLESKLRDLQFSKGLSNPLKRRDISI